MDLALTLLYLVPVALLALLLGSPGRHSRWLLTGILLALPVFYTGHYLMLQALQGWPSTAALPDSFRLLAFDIAEPDPKRDRGGHILLWIRAPDVERPRVHRLPYSRDLHQELVDAGQRQTQGRPQLGSRTPRSDAAGTGASPTQADAIRFRDETRAVLPSKGPES